MRAHKKQMIELMTTAIIKNIDWLRKHSKTSSELKTQ